MTRPSLTACAALVAALLLGACASDSLRSAVRPTPQDQAQGGGSGRAVSIAALMRVAAKTRAGGDSATAVALYRRAHALDQFNPEPLTRLGEALSDLGATNEAAEAFREALKLDPTDTDALRGLGAALIALNQPELALEQFEAALAIEEDHRSYSGLGVALDRMGDHALAQAYYRVGLELAPGNLTLLNNLGLSLALSGDHDAAIETLTQAAAHPAATARQRQNLALAYGLAGNPEAAARVARLDLDEEAVQSNLAYYSLLRAANDGALTAAAVGAKTGLPPAGPTPSRPLGTDGPGWELGAPSPAPSGSGMGREPGGPDGGVDSPPASAGAADQGPAVGGTLGVPVDATAAREADQSPGQPARPAEAVGGGEGGGERFVPQGVALVNPPVRRIRGAERPQAMAAPLSTSWTAAEPKAVEPAEPGDLAREDDGELPWREFQISRSDVSKLPDPPERGIPLVAGADVPAPGPDPTPAPDQEPPVQAEGPAPPHPTLAHQILRYWSGQLSDSADIGISL